MTRGSGPRARFMANGAARTGLVLLASIVLLALLGPLLWDAPPDRQELALGATAPSASHPFGTDCEGRDLLARVLDGGRVSLLVGFVATVVAVVIGVSFGALSGWLGGRADAILMRVVDLGFGLPYLFFVIVLMVWLGRSLVNVFIGLGAVSWLTMARIVRGEVLVIRDREYVLAARAAGVGPFAIVRRHVLPNAMGPIIVYATLTVPRVMLEEAFLSFLGLGVQPPQATWGSLLADGASLFREYPWMVLFPGAMLSLTLLALNFVGDGLRDAFDPRGEDRR